MLFEDRELETPERIAKSIGCDGKRIRNLIISGELKGLDIGTKLRPTYRVSKKAWDDYLKSKTIKPNRAKQRPTEPVVISKSYVGT